MKTKILSAIFCAILVAVSFFNSKEIQANPIDYPNYDGKPGYADMDECTIWFGPFGISGERVDCHSFTKDACFPKACGRGVSVELKLGKI